MSGITPAAIMSENQLRVISASIKGATIRKHIAAVNPEKRIPGPVYVPAQDVDVEISWSELHRAAKQDDVELAKIYSAVLIKARNALRDNPLRDQGISVVVTDCGTGGAVWDVWVMDASGAYRRDLMRADEGGQHPHRNMAQAEANEILERIKL